MGHAVIDGRADVAAALAIVEDRPGHAPVERDVGSRVGRLLGCATRTKGYLVVISAANHVERIGWINSNGRLIMRCRPFAVCVHIARTRGCRAANGAWRIFEVSLV